MYTSVKLNNGYDIPQLGFGVFMIPDHDQCKKSVLEALQLGYRHIDTAQLYRNEKAVGEAVRESGIPREEIFITTKIWTNDFGYQRTKAAILRSLTALNTPYIDLLLLHQQVGDFVGSWKALEEAVKEGVVRSIGISNFSIENVKKLLASAKIKPVVNQVEAHPYAQQKELRAFLDKQGIRIEAWYPIGHGDQGLIKHPVFLELASKYHKTTVQVILRWHIQTGYIVFPKSTNPVHIKENLDIFDFELSPQDMKKIEALDKNKKYFNYPPVFLRKFLFDLVGLSIKR